MCVCACVCVSLAHHRAEKSHFNSFFSPASPPPFLPLSCFQSCPLLLKKQCGKPPVHWWKCCPHYGSSRGQAMAASIQAASNWLQNDQLPLRKAGVGGGGGRRDLEKYGFYLIQLNHKNQTSVPSLLYTRCTLTSPCK